MASNFVPGGAARMPYGSLYTQMDQTLSRITSLYLVRVRKPVSLSNINGYLQNQGYIQSECVVRSILQKYPQNFEMYIDGICFVKLVTKVNLCKTHCKKKETCPGTIPFCSGLHVCKFFILSGNCTFGNRCTFGHDLTTSHNMNVLKEHLLDGASVNDLKLFLSQADNRTEVTAPRICKFYNNKPGCGMSNRGKICANLHICRHYIEGTCKFGRTCTRSHDLLDLTIKAILEKHGISTQRTPAEILAHLRNVLADNVSDGSSCASAPLAPKQDRMRIGSAVDCQTPSKDRVQNDEHVSICFYYLRGKCLYGDGCRNFHSHLLYQWRYRKSDDCDWVIVSPKENRDMELSYSDPKNKEYFLKVDENGTHCKVEFKSCVDMPGVDVARTSYKIQRLSTASSVAFERQQLTTKWNWYWVDQTGEWKEYGHADRAYVSDIDSHCIEQAYLNNPEGQMSFNTSGHQYILDFRKMCQRNLHHKTEREVCRRPVFVGPCSGPVSQLETKQMKLSHHDAASGGRRGGGVMLTEHEKAPPHWSRTDDLLDHCKLVEVQKRIPSTKKEYKEIEKLFCESMPSTVSIVSIERIENGELYCDYMRKKNRMEKKKKGIDERRLFHGTKSCYVDAICKQGFDFRLNGQSVGTRFGKGSYFATTSKYSHSYTDNKGVCSMFVVKVMVGEYALGKKTYVRPPLKNEKNLCGELYDSCVNDINDPTIFVIFENSGQVYPEYLITYEYKY